MNRYARALPMGTALLLAIGLLVHGTAVRAYDAEDDKAIKAAQSDAVALAKAIEGGKDGKDIAKNMKKKYEELNTVMQIYKPSAKKGLGIGPKGPGDGIESKIISLGKRALPVGTLDKQKADLIKIAYINLAMAEITKMYPPKPKGGKGPKDWNEHIASMQKSSKELLEAVKAGDPKKLKEAANNINSACNNCHSDFRD